MARTFSGAILARIMTKILSCIKIISLKKSALILFCSFVLLAASNAQLYYYGSNSRPLKSETGALVLKDVRQKSDNSYIIKSYEISEEEKNPGAWILKGRQKIKIEEDGSQIIRGKGEGVLSGKIFRKITLIKPAYYEFSESDEGRIRRKGFSSGYLPLHLEGQVTEYHTNGNIKSISQYKDNQLLSNQNWLRNGDKYIDTIFYSADQVPEFKNGPAFFHNYLLKQLYDSEIDLSQIQDVVELGWVVMENGEIEGIVTLSGRSRQLNEFLVNTLAGMPGEWQPAMLDGEPVRYFISIPLNFEQLEVSFQEMELSSGVLHYNKY